MTELGTHAINFPIELKFTKMIMYAILMKCLDPILIIACFLSAVQDPCIEKKNCLIYLSFINKLKKIKFQFWQT